MSEAKSGNFVVDILEWLKANPAWCGSISFAAVVGGLGLLAWNENDTKVLQGFSQAYTVACIWTVLWAAVGVMFWMHWFHYQIVPKVAPKPEAPYRPVVVSEPLPEPPPLISQVKKPPEPDPATRAKQNRILNEFDYLDRRLKLIITMLTMQGRKSFHADRSNSYLVILRNRGFVQIAPGDWAFTDTLFEFPDFFWEFCESRRDTWGKIMLKGDEQDIDVKEPWLDPRSRV